MLSVDISELDEDVREGLPGYIESKLKVKSEIEGAVVTFDDKSERTHVSSPQIRTYLKRFMHSKEIRKQYRLLSQEDGALKFVKLRPDQMEESEEEEKEKKKKKA